MGLSSVCSTVPIPPDWLNEIPVITKGESLIGSDYTDRIISAAKELKYDEIADDAVTLGMPNDSRIKYYKAGGYCGIYNGEIVYISMVSTGALNNYTIASNADIAPLSGKLSAFQTQSEPSSIIS